ncbi:amidohydrolase family protein [Caulobacter mirabilis]|uniref:amidohydrolase family protein n=1 Tax=Caulobacter mirabilis TaxID=69666 RepID=UPI001C0EDFC1|nr:amidohydrolase family protein [Caulobacter mirabilis]
MPAFAAEPAASAVRVDHHMHVHSPAILGFLEGYCASPGRTSPCPPAFTKPLTTDDLLRDMDAAGVQKGWLMSTAYLAQSPMMVPAAPNAVDILRSANDFTVAQARAHPDRLAAFIGVNPLTDAASPEIARWKGDPAVTGIKLHLTNSGLDLRAPDQTARLAAVFRAAAANGWVIMVHMRTRAEDYGARDAEIFLRDVLPAAGDAPVLIAHAGGWGGTDVHTLGALGAFADAIEREPAMRDRLWFDLAQVFNDKTATSDLQALAGLIRRIGPDRFVTGSDWPFAEDLKGYYARTYPRLPLTTEEWRAVSAAEPARR